MGRLSGQDFSECRPRPAQSDDPYPYWDKLEAGQARLVTRRGGQDLVYQPQYQHGRAHCSYTARLTDADLAATIITPFLREGNDAADVQAKQGAADIDVPKPILNLVQDTDNLVAKVIGHIGRKATQPKKVHKHRLASYGGRITCTRCWASCRENDAAGICHYAPSCVGHTGKLSPAHAPASRRLRPPRVDDTQSERIGTYVPPVPQAGLVGQSLAHGLARSVSGFSTICGLSPDPWKATTTSRRYFHPLGHISFHLSHRLHYRRGIALCSACGSFTNGSHPKSVTTYCWPRPRSGAGAVQKRRFFSRKPPSQVPWPLPEGVGPPPSGALHFPPSTAFLSSSSKTLKQPARAR